MRRRTALMLVMMALTGFAGCGGGGEKGKEGGDTGGSDVGKGAAAGKKELTIAVIPKGTSHDFWLSVRFGAEKAARELSKDGRTVKIDWQGPSNETGKADQKQIVETFIGQKVDGICLAPIDSDVFVPVVEQAAGEGVPVVLFDSGLSDFSNCVSYVATDNKRGGVIAGEHLAKLVKEGDRGDGVILLRYQAGSESTENREAGFLEAIGAADLKVLSENNRINSDAAEAIKVGESLMQEFNRPDEDKLVAGVFTVCEPNNKGMLQALENESLAGKVPFVGFDSDPRMVEGLRNGTVDGVVLQDPVNMGYLAVKTMVAHLDGDEVEDRIDTGVYLATPDNMEEEMMASLLAPKKHGHDDPE